MHVPATERKDQLIRATVELMRRDGVQRLNLRAIAEEAGASLAAVHYCFDGKDDLLRHAVEYWLQRMVELPEVDTEAGVGLEAAIDRIAGAFWTALEENPHDVLAQIELVAWSVREAPRLDLAESIYRRYEEALADVFTKALADAGQDVSWDMGDFARAFVMIVDGASLQYMADPGSDRHRRTFHRLLLLSAQDALKQS